jgi:hypothetical protein
MGRREGLLSPLAEGEFAPQAFDLGVSGLLQAQDKRIGDDCLPD